MYKTNIKNKFLLLFSIIQITEAKDITASKNLQKTAVAKKTPNKPTAAIKKNVSKVNISFKYGNVLMQSEDLTKMISEFRKENMKASTELTLPFLLEIITEEIYKIIPDEQKAAINNYSIKEQKNQLKSGVESELRKIVDQISITAEKTIMENINSFFASEINMEFIYLMKLSSMMATENNKEEIKSIFIKYKDLFITKTSLEAEIEAKKLIAQSTQANLDLEEINKMTVTSQNLSNEINTMIENDLDTVISLLTKIIKDGVKNKDVYFLNFQGRKISLDQILADIENNKNNEAFRIFLKGIFMLLIPANIQ